MYCAPNKIWEYSGFSIPMLANDVPGLKYTVEMYKAGLCVNTNDENEIRNAILQISSKYDEFSYNAERLYERIISIPLYYYMTDKDQDKVIEAVKKVVNYYRK